MDLEELKKELKIIRQGQGLTFAKLVDCPLVMEALGNQPLRVAYERFAEMVRSLGGDLQALALRNAYAIDMPAPNTLTRRHARFAGIYKLAPDTVELYESNMIKDSALRLHGDFQPMPPLPEASGEYHNSGLSGGFRPSALGDRFSELDGNARAMNAAS